MDSFLRIAELSDDQLADLRELEQELGVHLMAFEPGLSVAALDEDELAQVRALEKQLDATILAFEE